VATKVRWEEMFPDELDAALAYRPVVYLTYGPCEPHGLHAALGLDGLKAHGIACRAAEEHGGIVAPPFLWHVHEIGYEAPWAERTIGDRNPWLTSVPPWVFFKMVFFQLRAVAGRGFHAAIVLSGHAGGHEKDFRRIAAIFMQHSPLRIWAGGDSEAIEGMQYPGGHAGRGETSVLWALYPDLVDMSRLAQGAPDEVSHIMATGRDAAQSSPELGEELLAAHVAFLGHRADELLAAYQPPARPADRHPGNPLGALTFGEAERIWRAEVEPIMPEISSMDVWPGHAHVDPASAWAPNEMSHADLRWGYGDGPAT
jgi:creatinine amidohydrolase